VGFVNSILKASSLSTEEKEKIRSLLAERRLPELEILLEDLNAPAELRQTLLELALLVGREEIFPRLEKIAAQFDIQTDQRYLENLMARLKSEKLETFVTLDLGNLKGMRYYTGILFEIFSEGRGFPIASGGRYDRLLQQFGTDWPAVGFSFTLERLEALL
jgi:ATP phosphoribosyltransferase regulatory subunit